MICSTSFVNLAGPRLSSESARNNKKVGMMSLYNNVCRRRQKSVRRNEHGWPSLGFDVICVFLVHIVYVPYVFHLERIQPKMYCTLTDYTQSPLLTSYLFVYVRKLFLGYCSVAEEQTKKMNGHLVVFAIS